MALTDTFEEQGKALFKYRGRIPIILFLAAIPVIAFNDVAFGSDVTYWIWSGIAITLSVVGFMIRAVSIATTPKGTSGRNTKAQVAESLNKTGIYSMVRHPLYLGNYLMWIGIVAFTFDIVFIIIVTLAFWLYYERIMFAEERFLERKFGDEFLQWAGKVPAFLPAIQQYEKGAIPFSWKAVLRREYSGFLATVVGFLYVEVLRDSFREGIFTLGREVVAIFVISLVITLILRTLKHRTRWLHEDGRS